MVANTSDSTRVENDNAIPLPPPFGSSKGYYLVIYQNKVRSLHRLFMDAWLEATLNYRHWTKIRGPEGVWVINPIPGAVS